MITTSSNHKTTTEKTEPTLPYNDFGSWLRRQFPFKVQKISVNAGFTCPNRDGHIGTGGCTFCNNSTFNPQYCDCSKSIKEQLETGKSFFKNKYNAMRYIAYFQSYTNTYSTIDHLKRVYEEALNVEDVVGIAISTRPDCINKTLLDYLEQLSRQTFVIVEYGIESANNNTLIRINRGHTFECANNAINATTERGILTGGHIILGLPGEDEQEIIRQAPIISSTRLNVLKIHQLQIIKGTKLEQEFHKHPFKLYSVEEYINLVSLYIQFLRKDLVLERFVSQSPKELLVAPNWGLKNYEFTNLLVNHLRKTGAYQGKLSCMERYLSHPLPE